MVNLARFPIEQVEVVWACDVKIGGLRWNEGDGNGNTNGGEKEEG